MTNFHLIVLTIVMYQKILDKNRSTNNDLVNQY